VKFLSYRPFHQFRVFAIVLLSIGVYAQAPTPLPTGATLEEFVEKRLTKHPTEDGKKLKLKDVCAIETDLIAERVFREYGSMFAAEDSIGLPPRCIFDSASEVDEFQATLKTKAVSVGGVEIELQKSAADALERAVDEARSLGTRISALDGAIAGKRKYNDTVRIWNSRFFPALDHWVAKGRITRTEANYAASLPISDQIKRVMVWEAAGYYFSTNFSISIFNSVAPPGTSQHLSLVSFDVVESSVPVVRSILNKHGWFQTIRSDEPHFTYLGVPESELPSRGLKPLRQGSRVYWVPNLRQKPTRVSNDHF
jgi:hypothetical protein